MRSKLLLAVALLALVGPLSANAIPISYSVAYNSNVGVDGTGSFEFDAATSVFTNFNFTFAGVTSALPVISWTDPVFGGTRGQFFFEILTGQDIHPVGCGVLTTCGFTTGALVSTVLTSAEFRRSIPGISEYFFRNGANIVFSGTLVVTQVPEPMSLGLLGLGLLGLAISRKSRRAA